MRAVIRRESEAGASERRRVMSVQGQCSLGVGGYVVNYHQNHLVQGFDHAIID